MARRSDRQPTDAELEAQFVEAERNALAWTALGLSEARGARWMAIAAELRAELERRRRSL